MNNLSTSVNSSIEWCRNNIQELASQGYNQSEISRILQISQPTINRDNISKTAGKRQYQKIH
jgi:hypothetical protein